MEHVNTQLTVRTTILSYISIVISLSALGTGEFSASPPLLHTDSHSHSLQPAVK